MRPGRYRHPIVFQRESSTKDSTGQPVATWSQIGKAVASIEPIRGREYFNQSGEHSDVTHDIRCRGQKNLSLRPDDRILFGTRTFDVKSVIDAAESGRELRIMVVERLST